MRNLPSLERAESLFKAGKWEAAEVVYAAELQRELEAEVRAELLLKLGYCRERLNRWESAIATYAKVLKMEPALPKKVARAQLRTGYAMRRLGQDEAAIPVLLSAAENLEAEPNTRAEGYLYAAWALGSPRKGKRSAGDF